MRASESVRSERRAKAHHAARASILDAARLVAVRNGARNLSLRSVAAEAGYAPAALYGYFASKNELLLALAADDLSVLARAMKKAAGQKGAEQGLSAAIGIALSQLEHAETIVAAASALCPVPGTSDAERQFNGRLIAALNALSDASGRRAESREGQCDVLLLAATLAGLSVFGRSGRLAALGYSQRELLERLAASFSRTL
ncbi:MAG TPA: TetR family transcriptional regulator [Rhizomicrobium sp.]